MKKVILGTIASMVLSLSAFANTSTVNPSSGTGSMNSVPATVTEDSSSTKGAIVPDTETKMHQDSTTPAPGEIEAMEERTDMDSTSSDFESDMNRDSGATTEEMEIDEE